MKVHILGTGTSQGIPIISCECEVCRSVDKEDKRLRSSVWIHTALCSVVIDTGPDFRAQMIRAEAKDLDAVLFTHQHKDHVAGLDDIRPFNYLRNKVIEVYAEERVQKALKREFEYIFNAEGIFGLPKINLHLATPGEKIQLGDLEILPLRIMHGELPILGFRIGDFAYITDAKFVSEESKSLLKDLKILVVNALQPEPHHAHFTLAEAITFAQEINAEQTYFTHLSHNMGKHKEVTAQLPPKIHLAYDGLTFNLGL